jgi:NDP-sugar pyrophosphorylase family protein
MIEHCVPLSWNGDVFIGVKQEDSSIFFERLPEKLTVVPMPPTQGQAETIWRMLNAISQYYTSTDFLIINSDNAFDDPCLETFVSDCRKREACFGALTFMPTENKERYGYVDAHPIFTFGAEKDPISAHALAGAFYLRSFKVLQSAAKKAGKHKAAYLSDLFQFIDGKKVSIHIPKMALHEWGTPETLEADPGVSVDWSNL